MSHEYELSAGPGDRDRRSRERYVVGTALAKAVDLRSGFVARLPRAWQSRGSQASEYQPKQPPNEADED